MATASPNRETSRTARAGSLDPKVCYDALRSRDRRFDGLFFVGVKTTGIYCRPVCPARTPGSDRCTFFHHAAEAEREGFRACFRCRPELSPGSSSSPVDARSRLVQAATARIDAGALDEGSVADLAAELGVTERHLRRTMVDEHGVSPIAWAETRRLALAKQLLHETSLPITAVAFAAGFGSIRRFNTVFARRFGRTPTNVRATIGGGAAQDADARADVIRLRLELRPPYDWTRMLAFLAARAIPGVEEVELATAENPGSYARTVSGKGGGSGVVRVRRRSEHALELELPLTMARETLPIVAKLRALFDLDSEPSMVAAHLSRDPYLASSIVRRPGLRIPGSFDPFETAVRAILGQQVTVAAATTMSGRLVAKLGTPIAGTQTKQHAAPTAPLTHLFPTASTLSETPLETLQAIGLTRARAEAILTLARAFVDGIFDAQALLDPTALSSKLCTLRGIGPWTADYLLLRAASFPDAFPAGDLVLRRQLGVETSEDAESRVKAWSPWRGYGALHLWFGAGEGDAPAAAAASKTTKTKSRPVRSTRKTRKNRP